MELKINERKVAKKSDVKAMRRERKIPAVIYHKSKEAEAISVDSVEFSSLLRGIQQGRLSTTVFTLTDAKGAKRRAIVKDIQYNPVNYDVIHLDFEELIDNLPVNVKVPVECTKIADCVGIKLGGLLRQVIRHVKVNCLPKDMPSHFELDIQQMELYDQKRVKDIAMPETLKPLANSNEVVVVIAKR